ncbi:MAG: GspE/PulE family protein [Planctomycetota bacterium]
MTEAASSVHQAKIDAKRATAEFLRRIPREFARENLILSQGKDGDTERLAVAPSTDPLAIFNTGVRLGCPTQATLCDAEAIARAVDDAYGVDRDVPSFDGDIDLANPDELERLLGEIDRDLLATQGKGPIVKFVDAILFEALGRHASDVHVQPMTDRVLIRFRVDGALHTAREVPVKLLLPIVSRIKVMGRMDIAERRVAQDGRATVTLGDRSIDLRISTFPTSYGERAVLRLLDNATQLCDFDALEMPIEVGARFLECARRPNGIILVTGPTGSGKTTTLYSTLRRIASPATNIMTIEDPIEYELATVGLAVSQAQVNAKKGVTFATGLRHILRQDPDIILVGEIRDVETARMAIQSSLTGHLVFSTLHTNDAPSAVTRLIDLGIEPYLVASALSAVLAQRLVRTLHRPCDGKGCDTCFGTGLLGRRGIYELLPIDDSLRQLVLGQASLADLREAALARGHRTLAEDGRRLVAAGETTESEVRRVVEAIE